MQGSIDRLTDAGGNLPGATAYSFAAFGGRRTASGWSEAGSTWDDAHWTERGYTGHEHLDPARLIHMNGRLQDPLLARFLSPDPVQGDLTDPQSLNPYSYVRNSPFRFTDPTGYSDADTIFGRFNPCDRNPQCHVVYDANWTRGGEYYPVWSTGSKHFEPGFAWNWDPGSGLNSSDPSVGSWGRRESLWSGDSSGGRWQFRESSTGAPTLGSQPADPQRPDEGFDQCRAGGAVADGAGAAVAAGTFVAGIGSPQAASFAALAAFAIVTPTSYVTSGQGGAGAFAVASHIAAVVLSRSGSSFAEVLGAGAQAATPPGAYSVPIGALAGGAITAFKPVLGLGRTASSFVGAGGGARSAAAGVATSLVLRAATGCQ